MKKFAVVFMLVLCFGLFQVASGQGMKLGIGGNLTMPQGDWKDCVNDIGFGGTAQFIYMVTPEIGVLAQAGYLMFGGKDIDEGFYKYSYDITAIPILAGARYYFGAGEGPQPFVGALVGIHMMSSDVEVEFMGQKTSESTSDTEFSFAPVVGVEVSSFDISAFYMIISDANYIGARVGFNFPLGQ